MKNAGALLADDKPKLGKFNFESMKIAATSNDPAVRKQMFIEYFERFAEFPSFLFDNAEGIDSRLSQTIEELQNGPHMTKEFRKGIDQLLERLKTQ